MQQRRSLFWAGAGPSLLVLVVAGVAVGSSVSVPNAFTPNTLADANQVNENFNALATAVNDNDARVTALEGALGGLAANELVRASYAEATTAYTQDSTTFTMSVSNAVEVPTNGILLLWANVDAEWELPAGVNEFTRMWASIFVGGSAVGPQATHLFADGEYLEGPATVSVSAATMVTAGTVTVELRVRDAGQLGSTIQINDRSIMTLFVPFGNAGTQGVLKPILGGTRRTDPTEED